MRRVRESKVERDACAEAKENGWLVYKLSGNRGIPDRLFIKQGRVVFIEFKAPGGTLRAQQVKRIKEIRGAGVKAYVASSIEEVRTILGTTPVG